MTLRRALLAGAGALLCGLFVALGAWQVQRLGWKNDLMARVAARAHAEPVAAPARDTWPALRAEPAAEEYRRVRLSGEFLHRAEQLVQAVTERGAGFWVMAPLRTTDGSVVWINRGFVSSAAQWQIQREAARCNGPAIVTGLLRRSEPGGGFLRRNDPVAGRWFSRDVPALASAAGLPPAAVAPYFVDAGVDTPCATPDGPVGGLTVLRFSNNHLMYALTWFALAAMTVAATVFVLRDGARRQLPGQSGALS
jgi:surfeit locus 1 family protein